MSNLHPIMAEALRAFMPQAGVISDPRLELLMSEDDCDDYPCSGCSGSGEGQFEGTRCQRCGGSGIEK